MLSDCTLFRGRECDAKGLCCVYAYCKASSCAVRTAQSSDLCVRWEGGREHVHVCGSSTDGLIDGSMSSQSCNAPHNFLAFDFW